MSKIVGKGYTFEDLCLRPEYNNIDSRLHPSTKTWLTKNTQIDIPILNAPMDTVISEEMAKILLEYGGIPIFDRNAEIKHYENIKKKFPVSKVIVSIGIDKEFAKQVLDLGFDKLLLDTANGHAKFVENTIKDIKRNYPGVEVIAGNVCTGRAYTDLVNWGADCVRVGVGPGAACTTRMVTGVGVPQMSAIMDVAEEASRMKVPFIADGGIKSSREVALALAAGATTVMCGKILALTEESAAEKIHHPDGRMKAKYRGQASADYQKDHYGSVRKGTVPEGEMFWAPVTGSVKDVIDSLLAGLRSSMTYLAARDINEFQHKARFVEVTPTYMHESNIRRD